MKINFCFNALESRRNYSATSNSMKLVHWPLMGGLLYLVQQGGAYRQAGAPPSPLLAEIIHYVSSVSETRIKTILCAMQSNLRVCADFLFR